MIKIIKEGKIRSAHFVAKCGYCDSILEYSKSDVLDIWDNQRDGLSHKIHCPICMEDRIIYNIAILP